MKKIISLFLGAVILFTTNVNLFYTQTNSAKLDEDVHLEGKYADKLIDYADTLSSQENLNDMEKEKLILEMANKLYFDQKNGIQSKSYYPHTTLTKAEISVAASRPYQALTVKNTKTDADNMTKKIYGINGHNERSDVFRHAYFNLLLSKRIGVYSAKLWADAHEENPNSPALEKKMDLFNNQMGRIAYENNWPGNSNDTYEGTIAKMQLCGYLKVIDNKGKLVSSGDNQNCL